jgi:hypothetical protein
LTTLDRAGVYAQHVQQTEEKSKGSYDDSHADQVGADDLEEGVGRKRRR